MGASFCTMSVPVEGHDDSDIMGEFERAQDQDRYENGHCYSGGFGMADGLDLRKDLPVFPTCKAAEDWLSNNCIKWESAIGVRHKTVDDKEMWLIGAWCAS